jgi:hypothetical protein
MGVQMNMKPIFVLATAMLLLGGAPPSAQTADPITDPAVYAIYSGLLPPLWTHVSKGLVVLQQETEGPLPPLACSNTGFEGDADWSDLEQDFKRENSRVRIIQTLLLDVPHRLIARAEIRADDARLELKYPGTWNRRPESMEYASVSAVGFNVARTKALVYARTRSNGGYHRFNFRGGKWVDAGPGCGWVI